MEDNASGISVLLHCESFLGETVGGWKDSDGTDWPFYVMKFTGGPIANTWTYVTLGLSDRPLPWCCQEIRHELVFMARQDFGERNIPALLHQVGMEALARNQAYLRGEVIGPRGVLFSGTCMEALYVASPVYLPDDFGSHTTADGHSCIFAWLVPITAAEAEFVRVHGWNEFEEKLCTLDPDLLEFGRPSIV